MSGAGAVYLAAAEAAIEARPGHAAWVELGAEVLGAVAVRRPALAVAFDAFVGDPTAAGLLRTVRSTLAALTSGRAGATGNGFCHGGPNRAVEGGPRQQRETGAFGSGAGRASERVRIRRRGRWRSGNGAVGRGAVDVRPGGRALAGRNHVGGLAGVMGCHREDRAVSGYETPACMDHSYGVISPESTVSCGTGRIRNWCRHPCARLG